MKASTDRWLEVSRWRGKVQAAYLYLAPRPVKSARCLCRKPDIVVDIADDGSVVGVEIISPSVVTLADVNRVLAEFGLPLGTPEEFRPLWPA